MVWGGLPAKDNNVKGLEVGKPSAFILSVGLHKWYGYYGTWNGEQVLKIRAIIRPRIQMLIQKNWNWNPKEVPAALVIRGKTRRQFPEEDGWIKRVWSRHTEDAGQAFWRRKYSNTWPCRWTWSKLWVSLLHGSTYTKRLKRSHS